MQTSGAVQTTYTQYITPAQNGTPASMTGWDVDTKIFEDTSPAVGLPFGVAVSQGVSGDRGVRIGALSGSLFVGIVRADPTLRNNNAIFTDRYQDSDNVAVFVRGDIWVTVESAVSPGDSVLFNATTGVMGHVGGTAIPNARWMTSASAGGLAVVRLGNAAGSQ